MVFIRHTDGPAVHAEKPRREKLTPDQVFARRNALWLHASEIGLPDPATGRIRPHSITEIAALWDTWPMTVGRGIGYALLHKAAMAEGANFDE